MCENIKPTNHEIIKKIKQKLINYDDNPKVVIEKIKYNDKTFNLIQEGFLITGTKQRVVIKFLEKALKNNKDITTLVYSGTANGFGAVATAFGAYKFNLKSIVFISGHDEDTRQINTLHALNSKVYLCETYNFAKYFKYKKTDDKNNKTKKKYFIIPMGLNDDNHVMIDLLSKQIKEAIKDTSLENNTKKRFWLVAGSGGILMSLYLLFPTSEFFIYLTGHGRHKQKVIKWINQHKNIHILKQENINVDDIPYSTVKDYDDYIWHYVKKYAKDGDYIWNVSSDDYLFL